MRLARCVRAFGIAFDRAGVIGHRRFPRGYRVSYPIFMRALQGSYPIAHDLSKHRRVIRAPTGLTAKPVFHLRNDARGRTLHEQASRKADFPVARRGTRY